AGLDDAEVDDRLARRLDRALDAHPRAAGGRRRAGVADLAALLAVEGRPVAGEGDPGAGDRALGDRPVGGQGDEPPAAGDAAVLAVVEGRGGAGGVGEGHEDVGDGLALALEPRALARLGELALEAGLVDREPALAGDDLG